MSIDERQRHELYERLDEVLGTEQANTMMSHLPPVGWADVATKQDLDHLRSATRKDIDHLRADIATFREATKLDLDDLRAATRKDLDHLSEVFVLRMERGFAELRVEFHQGMRHQLIGIFGSVLVAVVVNQLLGKLV